MNKKKQPKIITIPLIGDLVVSFGRTIFGLLLGIIASGILIAISGVNPFLAYGALLKGAFGSMANFSNVLVRSSPLLLGGIGVAIGIKSGVWNIGIEGYMYMGAIGASLIAIPFNFPPLIEILLMFLSAMIVAGLWGAIPGALRAYIGVNEVTCTIMMNYIAIFFTTWFVSESALAESDAFYPMSKPFSENAILPKLMKGTSLHPGPFIGLVIWLLFVFIINNTSFGYRTRMLGGNPSASQYAGVDPKKQIVTVMVIGALFGGLSGAIEVAGLNSRVFMEFVTGVGYECVAVALVAGGNPLGVIFAALFFAVLKAGGATMSIETGVQSSISSIIIALCVIFVIGLGVQGRNRMTMVLDADDEEELDNKSIETEEV